MKLSSILSLLIINSTIAIPLNLSNKIDESELKKELLLAVEDSGLHFIRRANQIPQNAYNNPIQGVGDLGTNVLGGLIGGMFTDNYRDTGFVPGILNAVNNLLEGIFNKQF